LSFIDENCKRRRCERFCVRGDREKGVFVYCLRFVQLTNAVAFRKNNLVVFDDRNCESGDFPVFPDTSDVLVDLLKTSSEILSRYRPGDSQKRDDQEEQTSTIQSHRQ